MLCGQKNTFFEGRKCNMETKGNCHIMSPIHMTDAVGGRLHFYSWIGKHKFFILQEETLKLEFN